MKQCIGVIAFLTAIAVSGLALASHHEAGESKKMKTTSTESKEITDDDPAAVTCRHGGMIRTIAIAYPQGGKVPCEVHYSKKTEMPGSDPSVPWRAENTEGYCEQQAAHLKEKLTGFGWDCA